MRLPSSLASFLPAVLLFAAGALPAAEPAAGGLVLERFETTENTSGLTLETGLAREGMACGRWERMDQTSGVGLKKVPQDWSGYTDQQQPAVAIKDLCAGHGPVRVQITLPDGTNDQIAADQGAEVTRQRPGRAAEPWVSVK